MCGILGCLGIKLPNGKDEFDLALDQLVHRGPDDKGVFEDENVFLGHRRLSILDLTSAGHQPMVDSDTGMVICFNGEVYNYVELREELRGRGYIFHTRTDTEVVLKAFMHWGAGCLNRFNGMWSMAIWDPKKKTLFVSRDRFGVKPFYYSRHGGGFAFASEPKALLSLFSQLKAVDHVVLYNFLARGELYTQGRSFYAGIELLPPAHFGIYYADNKRFVANRYWSLPHEAYAGSGEGVYEDVFERLFDDAVKIRLRSDVPVGVSLSGGIDSTAVLAASQRSAGGQRICFTSVYGNENRGESDWARKAARPYGITPIEVEAPLDEWFECMRKIVWHMDGPGYSPAVYPVWKLMQRAREEGVPVLLEGQGADESFGGYPQYSVLQLIAHLKKVTRKPSVNELKAVLTTWRRMVATFSLRYSLLWMFREAFPRMIDYRRMHMGALYALSSDFVASAERSDRHTPIPDAQPGMDAVTRRLWEDYTRSILPGLLQYGDSISMAHSIESRLPFMDYRLAEWIFSVDGNAKIKNGETKWLVRRYLERAAQSEIAQRKDKLGYPTPADAWLAKDNGAFPRSILLGNDARCREYCSQSRIEKLINMHCSGKTGVGNHVYRLFSTELWLRECLA